MMALHAAAPAAKHVAKLPAKPLLDDIDLDRVRLASASRVAEAPTSADGRKRAIGWIFRRRYTVKEKAQHARTAVQLMEDGKTIREVAEMCLVPAANICKWIREFKSSKSDHPERGAKKTARTPLKFGKTQRRVERLVLDFCRKQRKQRLAVTHHSVQRKARLVAE